MDSRQGEGLMGNTENNMDGGMDDSWEEIEVRTLYQFRISINSKFDYS